MDPSSREDLSALMDGELATEPTRFLLRRLDHDPELAATWSRWHVIRACLASDASRLSMSKPGDDLAARVAAALESEAGTRARQRHWTRYVGGSAIAAGVAVAALMLNAPNSRIDAPAPVAQSRPSAAGTAGGSTGTSLAEATHPAAPGAVTPPWMLSRQPTVLSAEPASANVVYGTGLMQPDYLRRATFARDAMLPFANAQPPDQSGLPFSVVLLPGMPASGSSTGRH